MTLIEFLRARLDDRHARAAKLLRYAQENDVAVRDPRLLGRHIPGWHEWPEVEQMARHLLADVEAKRRIVDGLVEADPHSGYITATFTAQDVLALLALPDSDHADYDPEWRPG